jgi:hypothetical protein
MLTRQAEGRTVFLHVGKLVRSADNAAIRLTPLVHVQTGTKARVGAGGTYNSAMVLTIQGVWIDQRKGVTSVRDTVFTATVDFGQQNLNRPRIDVAGSPTAQLPDSSTWFPAVPVSISNENRPMGSGPVNITATIAETAAARDLAGSMAKQADNLLDQVASRVQQQLAPAQ